MEVEKHQSSRGRFLRGVGLTLAAAVGAAAYPAVARASVNCCPTSGCETLQCGPGERRFFCDCAPGLPSYCICSTSPGCYTGGC